MFPDSDSKSARLFERSKSVMPGGGTRHPVMFPPYPIYAEDAGGCRLLDVDGVDRIDFVNNYSSQIHGHAHPAIVEALTEQARHITSAILPTEWELKLAEIIRSRIASIESLRFCNSGTEATMIAVKAARARTGRRLVMKMEGGYHGQYPELETSFLSLPHQWGDEAEPNRVPFADHTPQSVLDNVIVAPINRTDLTRALIHKYAEDMAAIIIDPFPSRMQFLKANTDYLKMLREEADEQGIVLIFDEVFCLRAGYGGAQGQCGVSPDITTMGKIIGGGLPIGAIGGSRDAMSVFASPGPNQKPPVFHGGTFTANPMSMVAGITAMELLTHEAFEDLQQKGDRLRKGLAAAAADAGITVQILGDASLTGVAFNPEPFDSYREMILGAGPNQREVMFDFHRRMLNEGVLISPQAILVGSTPMTDQDIDFTVEAARRAFHGMKSDQVWA